MAEKKCTFRINGEVHSRGVGEKDCAAKRKAFNKFKKERDAKTRELLGMKPKDTTATKNKNPKPNKKKKKLGKIVTGIKQGIKRRIETRKKKKERKRSYNPYD